MTAAARLRGAALLQRGAEDLVAVAHGTAGPGAGADCPRETRFQTASVSKQFTAAAVLLLADRGILSVTDPVRDWLDGCPAAWDRITVHHLLTNSAGLVHWPALPGLDATSPIAADELFRRIADVPLLGPPGASFSYSSPGFVLLGRIVERASGQPYAAFLDREIFRPLGLTATFSGIPGDEPGLAAGHHDGAAVPSVDLGTVSLGTGSIWSTVGDLARWDRALAAGGLLSDEARQAMFTVHAPVADDDGVVRTEGYGYGWFIGTAADGHRIRYHPGDQPGFRSFNAWFPDDDVRLVILSNEGATSLDPVIHELVRIAFPGTA